MLLDDDIKFYNNSFKFMDLNIKKNKKKYVGFAFNNIQLNKSKNLLEKIKVSKFIEQIGLYSSHPGKVMENGWQTKIINQKKNLDSQWASTAAIVLKKNFLAGKSFEKNFGTYSYLEDLDFSLQLNPRRNYLFLIASNAKFIHLKEVVRTSFVFGFYEFINRYMIVKKFGLSKLQFFFMAIVKIFLVICSIVSNYKNIFKLTGNIVGIIACVIFIKTKK